MSPALVDALKALAGRRDLTGDEAEAAVGAVLSGGANDVEIASFLTGLRVKGETADELAGAVRAVRARVDRGGLSLPTSGLLDTCGTGGDGAHTVNVSTATAIVVAACGVPVAKHGNRAASGNSGSAEVLTELGVAIDVEPAVLRRCLEEIGITFLYAPRFHPGLKTIASVRRALPFRTLFNFVGPLVNPAEPEYQLVGVAGVSQAELVADALARLGVRRAAVVTGSDGLDEVSLDGPTHVRRVENGAVTEYHWLPSDFGLGRVTPAEIRVSGPWDSAARIRRLLAGEPGPVREIVLANAAAALWVTGELSLPGNVSRSAEAIDSGRASRLLERWGQLSRSGAP